MKMDWQEKLIDAHMQDEDRFEELVEMYLQWDCDPRDKQNILTAIYEDALCDDETLELISECIQNRDEGQLGKVVMAKIVGYWEKEARYKAERGE